MKQLLLTVVIALLWGVSLSAQVRTKKYNKFYDRTEYFDAYGNLIGYSKYNDFYDRWEFFRP